MKNLFYIRSITKVTSLFLLISVSFSCNKFIDIVPDNVASLDAVFRLRSQAEKYLFTCYSYLPYVRAGSTYNIVADPGFVGGNDWWLPQLTLGVIENGELLRGNQGVVSPIGNFWDGGNNAVHGTQMSMYEGIRDCNTFLERIDEVVDLRKDEKSRWIAEVKFLKAYYNFLLVKRYGPIILNKELTPVSASPEKMQQARSPVDSCFDYMEQLIDESIPDLPNRILNETSELGRITKAIALSVKAEILVTAASPLFNGNGDYFDFVNPDGTHLFNSDFEISKWEKAALACKEAVEFCESNGYKLFYYDDANLPYSVPEEVGVRLGIRLGVTEKWNSGVIWALNSRIIQHTQNLSFPRGLIPDLISNNSAQGYLAPTMNMAELFYTENGLPINEDKTWDYSDRFKIQKIEIEKYKYQLLLGSETARFNFDREPRYYADLGFDRGLWFGQGNFDADNQLVILNRKGEPAGALDSRNFSTTGFFTKKLIPIGTTLGRGNEIHRDLYPWPIMRLNNLYLLYCEAKNEAEGPSEKVYRYLDLIRARAGIPSLEDSWSQYSFHPNKIKDKDGLREVIHQERQIELAFEGKRYWDLRRWKKAEEEYNNQILGWSVENSDAEGYYKPKILFAPSFELKDYFVPISENVLLRNKSIEQNPGWE